MYNMKNKNKPRTLNPKIMYNNVHGSVVGTQICSHVFVAVVLL